MFPCPPSPRRRLRLPLGLAIAAALSAGVGTVAAQEVADDAQARTLDSVSVTGSRLPGTDLTAASPLTIIDRQAIEATGFNSVGEVLRSLPVASAATTDTAGRGNNGSANVALRGLSAVNTLVLLNGRRLISDNATGTVDLNSIPFEAVERIEVLQDGASAVYGSDAISGVVNIITRRNVDGATATAGYGISSRGDLPDRSLGFAFGKQGDRGQFLLVGSYRNRDGNRIADRPVSRDPDWRSRGGRNWRDWAPVTGTALGGLDDTGNLYIIREGVGQVTSTADLREAVFPGTGTPLNSGNDGINYWKYESSVVDLEQKNLWFSGEYDFSDGLTGFAEASHVQRDSLGFYAPSYIDGGFTVSAGNLYNPFGRDLSLFRTFVEQPFGQTRQQKIDSSTRRAVVGLKGGFGDSSSWQWDASGNLQKLELHRYAGRSIDDAKLALAAGDSAACLATPGCVPVNFFGPAGSISQQMLDWFTYDGFQDIESELKSFTANASGTLFPLPAGDLNLAAGVEYREEDYWARSTDNPNLDDDFPVYAPPTRKVSEVYAEAGIPLLADKPGAYSLDLQLAARYSHYSTFGSTTNPKASLKWKPIEQLMLRYSWGQGFRTPNFAESSSQLTRGYAPQIDPCAGEDYAAYPGCHGVQAPVTTGTWTVRGGNPDLQPETSDTSTVGLVWTPGATLSFTLDYYRIRKENIIATADVNYIIEQNALGLQFLDRVVRKADGSIDSVTATMDNLLEQRIDGADFGVNYVLSTQDWGRLTFNNQVTWIHRYESSPSASSPPIERVGTYTTALGTIPRWKAAGSATWNLGDWTFNYGLRYVGAVENQASIRRDGKYLRADSYLQHDLGVSRQFLDRALKLTLGVQNVFDRMPPWLEGNYYNGFDSGTFDSRGRYYALNAEYRF